MKTQIIVMSLSLLAVSACGTSTPYRCTSHNAEVCNLQQRIVRLEDLHSYPREKAPIVMTDQELIDELRRRKQAITYPTQ